LQRGVDLAALLIQMDNGVHFRISACFRGTGMGAFLFALLT
jgi:hypothetical protein